MKIKSLLILLCLGLTNCSVTSNFSILTNETLIATQYKTIEHGQLIFLTFINNEKVKRIIYHYAINITEKKVACVKIAEDIYETKNKSTYLNDYVFRTTEKFKLSQKNSWRAKYYECFSSNFLDMTNDEKIDLLKRLSEK